MIYLPIIGTRIASPSLNIITRIQYGTRLYYQSSGNIPLSTCGKILAIYNVIILTSVVTNLAVGAYEPLKEGIKSGIYALDHWSQISIS